MRDYSIFELGITLLIVSDVLINILSQVSIEYTILNHLFIIGLFYLKIAKEGSKLIIFYLIVSEISLICYHLASSVQFIRYISLGSALFFLLLFIFSWYKYPIYKFPEISQNKILGYKEAFYNGTLCSFYYPAKPNTGHKTKLQLRDDTEVQKYNLLFKAQNRRQMPDFILQFLFSHFLKSYIYVYQDAELEPKLNLQYDTIIFCPGFVSSRKCSTYLMSNLATSGYIIVSPEYKDLPDVPDIYSNDEQRIAAATSSSVTRRINFLEDIIQQISNGQFYTQYFGKEYKQGNVFVGGASMGGAVLKFGLQTKYKVDGIILYDPFYLFQNPDEVNIQNTTAKIFGITSNKYRFMGKRSWQDYIKRLLEKNVELKNRIEITTMIESGHLDYGDSIFQSSGEMPTEFSGYEHVPENFQIILQGTLHFINNVSSNQEDALLSTRNYLDDKFKSKIYFLQEK